METITNKSKSFILAGWLRAIGLKKSHLILLIIFIFFFWLVPKDAFFLWIIYCPFLSAFQMYRHSRLLNEITIRNWNIPTRERETYFDNAHYFNIVKSIYYRHDYIYFFASSSPNCHQIRCFEVIADLYFLSIFVLFSFVCLFVSFLCHAKKPLEKCSL